MYKIIDYKKELQLFCCEDACNIIIQFASFYVSEFTEDFVQDCITNREYIYYTTRQNKYKHKYIGLYRTLVQYLYFNNRNNDIITLLQNAISIAAKYLQNKDWRGSTELFYLCELNLTEIIKKIQGLKIKHFLNENVQSQTEF